MSSPICLLLQPEPIGLSGYKEGPPSLHMKDITGAGNHPATELFFYIY